MLFDYESFDLWERYLVATLGSSEADVTTTLRRIAATGHRLRPWTAEDAPMVEWTSRVLTADHSGGHSVEPIGKDQQARGPFVDLETAGAMYERFLGSDAYLRACATVPDGLIPPVLPHRLAERDERWVAPAWNSHARHVLRYLATKAFASWTAYQSRGVRTQIAELFMTAAVLRVECVRASARAHHALDSTTLLEAIRASDWLLVHLADRDRLMAWLGEAETETETETRDKGRGMMLASSRRARVSRRLSTLAAVLAVGIVAGAPSQLQSQQSPTSRLSASSFPLEEATIADLQLRMSSGATSSRAIVEQYLARIDALDRQGPEVKSIIELNPEALGIADRLDAERKAGRIRGPLHGIPVVIKDNIASGDRMLTTAGSRALATAPRRAMRSSSQRLRDAGAVLLARPT